MENQTLWDQLLNMETNIWAVCFCFFCLHKNCVTAWKFHQNIQNTTCQMSSLTLEVLVANINKEQTNYLSCSVIQVSEKNSVKISSEWCILSQNMTLFFQANCQKMRRQTPKKQTKHYIVLSTLLIPGQMAFTLESRAATGVLWCTFLHHT